MAKRVAVELGEEVFDKTFLGLIADQEALKGLLGSCAVFELEAGEPLVREGRAAADMVLLLSGKAGGLGPWTVADLRAVLSGGTYQETITAAEQTRVLLVPWRKLRELVRLTPGLEAYVERTGVEGPLKALDRQLEDMECSKGFRVALVSKLVSSAMTAGAWLWREGEAPDFVFYMGAGPLQAYKKIAGSALKALWQVPQATWQLWEECREGKALGHSLKAESALEVHKLSKEDLKSLEEGFAEDFPKFEALARAPVESAEAEEDEKEVEKLEDLFPPMPRKVPSFRFQYPFIQQNDEMDCGPACLAMLSRYFGNDIPIQYWRERMGTDQRGTSLFDISRAAETVGFVAHGLEIPDLDAIDGSLFPFIALRRYHYMVVYKKKGNTVIVGDPAIGVRKMALKDFLDGYEGYAVLLKPTEQFYRETVADRGRSRYWEMLKGHERELGVILACSLLLTGLNMVPPFLSQFILDEVLAKKDVHLLVLALAGVGLLTLMISLTSWLKSYFLAYVTSKVDFSTSSAFMRKLFSLPYDFFATRHVGDFTRRLAELERVRGFFMSQFVSLLLDFINLGFYGVVLFFYNPKIAAATFISAPFLLLVSFFFSKRFQVALNEQFSARSDQEALVSDLIKGVATVKVTGAELSSRWRFEEAIVRTLRARNDFAMTAAALGGVAGLINQGVRFGLIGMAAYLAIQGGMTPGQVISASMLVNYVLGPFHNLADAWDEFQDIKVVMGRLDDVMLATPERSPSSRALIKKRLRGEIEFRDVWFRYGGESSDWVLKGMSFHILPGQSVAVVGPSGSGKSTLALLTARLYEPQKGLILVDGRDYRDYDRQWLRSQVGLLLQETNLFFGTVFENIAYADARPDMAKVQEAAELACAHGFVAEKPAGYAYRITHGGLGLSGGEKQRISIARTLYMNPAILFLDEATSALDAEAERSVTANLRGDAGGRTVISIAHRYSTVKATDYAMVVEGGRVVEFGGHEELMGKGGTYTRLFADQIEG